MSGEFLSFDIETVRHESIEEWVDRPQVNLQQPDLESVAAPKNYKDADKIKEYVEQRQADLVAEAELDYERGLEKAEQEYEALLEKGGLDADLGQVRAIGYLQYPGTTVQAVLAPEDKSERELLELFWQLMLDARCQTVGFNHRRFDLPFLLRRSFDLRVNVPMKPRLAKFQNTPTTDLYEILYNWEYQTGIIPKGLKWLTRRYGLDNPLPDFDGSQVAVMTELECRAYVANDVYVQTQLLQRMDGIYFPKMLADDFELGRPRQVVDYLEWLAENDELPEPEEVLAVM